MSTNNSNIINGYDLVQAKSALPQFIQCSTRYKELSQLFSQTEYQETLLDIITTTIKRIRRYQSSKVIDLARLVKLLYGIQKHDSIQIKYNGKTQFDFPYGETTRLLFDTFNKELATIYPPEKMMQFYKFLYAELLWNEEIKSPIDNNDTKILLFEYNASKNYKRIVAFEKEDDIDIFQMAFQVLNICLHQLGISRSKNTCDNLDVGSTVQLNDPVEIFCSFYCFHIVTHFQKLKKIHFLKLL